MTARTARVVYRALDGWPFPAEQVQTTPFSSAWSATLDLLLREADHLGAPIVVIELDLPPGAIRRDEQLRSDARVASERVRVSMTTRQGPMAWATARYGTPMRGGQGWRENVRAIALTMESLRAVERYGAVRGQQYQGFLAIEAAAGPTSGFASADEALRWMQGEAGMPGAAATSAYRVLARRFHPDAGGDPADFARLTAARDLLQAAGLLDSPGATP